MIETETAVLFVAAGLIPGSAAIFAVYSILDKSLAHSVVAMILSVTISYLFSTIIEFPVSETELGVAAAGAWVGICLTVFMFEPGVQRSRDRDESSGEDSESSDELSTPQF